MKIMHKILIGIFLSMVLIGCSQNLKKQKVEEIEKIKAGASETGNDLIFQFTAGESHNHPTFVIWVEDLEGNFQHTLYVTKSVSSGIWGHGELEPGKWKDKPGKAVRTASLPYWFHKRSDDYLPAIPNDIDAIPDAITSATPKSDFYLHTKSGMETGQKFRILMEVNQTWDWNDYWHNNKFPDDIDYKSSCQPALVYAVTMDPNSKLSEYYLNPIGHSHYSGDDGLLYTDISTITTALKIFDKIKVIVK
ncbi:MAG: hypothetical protein JXQ65_00955 [Candidatus Marinimicrobia bacterium]|nr:hypothetical protein [Candidatus Neomarinimicrobiota bacterium]